MGGDAVTDVEMDPDLDEDEEDDELPARNVWDLDRLDDERATQVACDSVYRSYERRLVDRGLAARQGKFKPSKANNGDEMRLDEHQRASIDNMITDAIESGHRTMGAIVDATGLKRSQVDRGLKTLLDDTTIRRTGKPRSNSSRYYLASEPTEATSDVVPPRKSKAARAPQAPTAETQPVESPKESAQKKPALDRLTVERARVEGYLEGLRFLESL